ncbi:hypothetical protein INR49_002475 [Caranx melampygus]|nr:hypothetical protein INR49_002475 [Caranx melampygus]
MSSGTGNPRRTPVLRLKFIPGKPYTSATGRLGFELLVLKAEESALFPGVLDRFIDRCHTAGHDRTQEQQAAREYESPGSRPSLAHLPYTSGQACQTLVNSVAGKTVKWIGERLCLSVPSVEHRQMLSTCWELQKEKERSYLVVVVRLNPAVTMADSGKTNESGTAAAEPANGDQQNVFLE